MKSLHIIPSVAPVRDSPSQNVLQLVQALHKCRLDTEFVTTNANSPELLDVPL